MLSDHIDLFEAGSWPPRVVELEDGSFKTLFIDHWAWGELTKDRVGLLPESDPNFGTFNRLRSAVMTGAVVVPLTISNYVENQSRTYADARWGFAVTVGEISGFNTFSVTGLEIEEAVKAASTFRGVGEFYWSVQD